MTAPSPGPQPESLASKTARGVMWMMLLKVAIRSLGLISTLILVRILSPQDFGLVAMATVFIAILETISWFSFDVVLIQKQTARRDHYDTAWTFSVIFRSASALILLAVAYPVAQYYGEPRVFTLILILAAGVLISGFANIGVVDFRKNMQFDKDFKFMFLRKLSAFCVTVPLAFVLRNYWALIAGMMTGRIVSLILSYTMAPYRPRFSIAARAELFHFSKWLFLNNVIGAVRMRGAELIIGRVAGARSLGLFTVSYEISSLPTTELVAPINRAVFPGYAKISSDMSALRRGYLSVISMIALIAVPAGAGIAATAPVLVPVVLGEKWLTTASLITILGFSGVVSALQTNMASVYLALAKPHVLTWLQSLHLAVLIAVALPAIAKYGVEGAAWSYLGASLLLLPLNYAVMFRTISLRPLTFLAQLWRPLLATGVMYVAVRSLVTELYARSGFNPTLLDMGIAISAGMVIYALCVSIFWLLSGRPRGAETYVIEALRARLHARRAPAVQPTSTQESGRISIANDSDGAQ